MSSKHKNILIVVLILFALAMIIIGVQSEIVPPILTGIGFIIITSYLKLKADYFNFFIQEDRKSHH
jgi:hypothetical protein